MEMNVVVLKNIGRCIVMDIYVLVMNMNVLEDRVVVVDKRIDLKLNILKNFLKKILKNTDIFIIQKNTLIGQKNTQNIMNKIFQQKK